MKMCHGLGLIASANGFACESHLLRVACQTQGLALTMPWTLQRTFGLRLSTMLHDLTLGFALHAANEQKRKQPKALLFQTLLVYAPCMHKQTPTNTEQCRS